MTPKEMSKYDQSLCLIAESFPPFLKRFYDNLISNGFKEEQAFELVKTYLAGLAKGN